MTMTKPSQDQIKKETPDDPEVKAMQTAGGCFSLFCSVVVMMTIGTIAKGIVLYYMWGWFMVPFGMAQISIAWALGISLLVGELCHSHHKPAQISKKIEDNVATFIMYATLHIININAFAFILGWIVHKLM